MAIRAAEQADYQARQAAVANTRGSTNGAGRDSSTSPSGNHAPSTSSARAVEVQGGREGGTSNRDEGKRASVGIVPTKEDQADALKPVYSSESSPVQPPGSPPPPQTTLSFPGTSSPPPNQPQKEPGQPKSSSSKAKSDSKSKAKTKSQQQQQLASSSRTTEQVLNIDGSSTQTQGGQPPQSSQVLVPPAS